MTQSDEQAKADKRKAQLDTIEELFKLDSWLSAWEVSFLTNIQKTLKNRSNLSDKQTKVLDDLAKKAMERLD